MAGGFRGPWIGGAPAVSVVTSANVPVTVFPAGSIMNGGDIVNPSNAPATLYVDVCAPASVGAVTSLPLLPGQPFHLPGPFASDVTVVSTVAGHSFNAVKY